MSSVFLRMTVTHRRNEKKMLCKICSRPRCLFVCFYGPSVEVNKLVFEGQLQQIPNRGDHVGNQSENNIYFRLHTCESRHMKTRRKLNPFLYRFLQVFTLLSFLTSPVYHYTPFFWNSLCKLSVKLLVCSLDSLSCWIISRNWTKSGADVFQVYSIFFSCDHPRLILGWRGYLMSLFFLWSLGCFWKLPKIEWHCAFISETLRSKFFGISR